MHLERLARAHDRVGVHLRALIMVNALDMSIKPQRRIAIFFLCHHVSEEPCVVQLRRSASLRNVVIVAYACSTHQFYRAAVEIIKQLNQCMHWHLCTQRSVDRLPNTQFLTTVLCSVLLAIYSDESCHGVHGSFVSSGCTPAFIVRH